MDEENLQTPLRRTKSRFQPGPTHSDVKALTCNPKYLSFLRTDPSQSLKLLPIAQKEVLSPLLLLVGLLYNNLEPFKLESEL